MATFRFWRPVDFQNADLFWIFDDQASYTIISAPGHPDSALEVLCADGQQKAILEGAGFAIENGAVTAGRITTLSLTMQDDDGDFCVEMSEIDWLNLSAPALYRAQQTPALADDRALLAKALAGADSIRGSDVNDALLGDNGNDRIDGRLGNDTLDGGRGADTLTGDKGNDRLIGGPGNDAIFATFGHDRIILGDHSGHDVIRGFADHDYYGDTKLVFLSGAAGFDDLTITADGDDVLVAFGHASVLLQDYLHDHAFADLGRDDFVFY